MLNRAHSVQLRPLPFPLRDAVRMLGFESEQETAEFCGVHGLMVAKGRVQFVRGEAVQPEQAVPVSQCPMLVGSKCRTSLGEVSILWILLHTVGHYLNTILHTTAHCWALYCILLHTVGYYIAYYCTLLGTTLYTTAHYCGTVLTLLAFMHGHTFVLDSQADHCLSTSGGVRGTPPPSPRPPHPLL